MSSGSGTITTGADPAVVGPYLAEVLHDGGWADCRISLLAGGKSNLTYRVDSPSGAVVLRRPPLGDVLATAHDMVREHTVLSALAATSVPVPRMFHLCLDPLVLGQPFFVMQLIEGHVCAERLPHGYAETTSARQAIGRGVVDVLAEIHAVRVEEIGLHNLGRPTGFLQRQITRWARQWQATRLEGHDALDQLAVALADRVPTTQRATLLHGDFRLDNTVLAPTRPGVIAAVLDWEMSTLGDPLADFGLLLTYWSQVDDDGPRRLAFPVPGATACDGFPRRADVMEHYALRTGLDLDALPWYEAFGAFKLAVVCAGIAARSRSGAMADADLGDVAPRIAPFVELGRSLLL